MYKRQLLATSLGADDCDERVCLCVCVRACVCVCVFVCVCLSAIISSELHARCSPNLLFMLPMALARSCAGGIMMRYVLPVYGWLE